ncbi:ORFL89C [Human betaherpesvirus 5]|nr:ORFL89C [Human betaherpesvirus 5]QHX40400.1 ORFL89C [Human betaherpesvirus 5]
MWRHSRRRSASWRGIPSCDLLTAVVPVVLVSPPSFSLFSLLSFPVSGSAAATSCSAVFSPTSLVAVAATAAAATDGGGNNSSVKLTSGSGDDGGGDDTATVNRVTSVGLSPIIWSPPPPSLPVPVSSGVAVSAVSG